MSLPLLPYRLEIASRAAAGIIGGYALTALAVSVLALALPMERAAATLTATMASFAIYAAAVLWAFASRSHWRAWAGIGVPAAVLALLMGLRPLLGML